MAKLEIAERGENYIIYKNESENPKSGAVIRIDNVRLSYPNLAEPRKGKTEGARAKYSIVALMDKDTHEDAYKAINAYAIKFGKSNRYTPTSDRKFIGDGADYMPDKPEYEISYYVKASDTNRPQVRSADNFLIDDVEKIREQFYGGCFGSVLIQPWFQDNEIGGKRVNANLRAVKFVSDGERFGGAVMDYASAWDDDNEFDDEL